ncbi:MAG: hypothetical protein ACK4QW_01750 [Alphaproteobacteria bacterium]
MTHRTEGRRPRLRRAAVVVGTVLLAWLWLAADATARGYASLYDDAELAQWAERYRPGILSNLEEVLRPALTPEERRGLRHLRIEIPLRAASGHPLDFYALASGTVVLPAMSLKFLDDVSVAFAWLNRNGYSPETVPEYVGMLKYGRESDFGHWPAPLSALRIPDDALSDPAVDDLAQKIFKSAVVFILLHEMGHVLHGHPGYGPLIQRADARANEEEADRFALDVMRRLPAQPTGMFLVFQLMAYAGPNRGDFTDDAAWRAALDRATHPVTPDRMRAIADHLRRHARDFAFEYSDREAGHRSVLFVADQIGMVAETLSDPDLQRLVAQTSRRATLAGLAPRRHGEFVGRPAGPDANAVAFAGTFAGTVEIESETFPVQVVLRRDGRRVSGLFSIGAGIGEIDGVVAENVLFFSWRTGDDSGRGTLRPDGSGLAGRWGYGSSADDGGAWRMAPAR